MSTIKKLIDNFSRLSFNWYPFLTPGGALCTKTPVLAEICFGPHAGSPWAQFGEPR
jgi:hypothetical protein